MPFTLIRGAFAPGFGRPDGDSMRFVPDDPALVLRLRRRGRPPKINPDNGSVQLRYEAIDAMESGALAPFPAEATVSNLDLAGTGDGAREARGHVLSTQLGPNGRPIVFAFAGEAPEADGASVFLDAERMTESVNLRQLERGHAYPLFYDTLFDDLRERCAEVSNRAKADGLGVWAADRTTTGAEWTGDPDTLPPIFPKLWRRIDRYVGDDTFFDPGRPFARLTDWIEQQSDERVVVPGCGRFTGFDDVIETTDTIVRLTVEPHELVVISR